MQFKTSFCGPCSTQAQILGRMKPLWHHFAVQLLQTAPATATQPGTLHYLFSKVPLCLNCTLCSVSGTSSGELSERLKIWKLPQSSHSDRGKYHSYSVKRMTLTDCKEEGTGTDRAGKESSNVHFHCGGHEQAIKHWLSTRDRHQICDTSQKGSGR